jgi:hypothetical protein
MSSNNSFSITTLFQTIFNINKFTINFLIQERLLQNHFSLFLMHKNYVFKYLISWGLIFITIFNQTCIEFDAATQMKLRQNFDFLINKTAFTLLSIVSNKYSESKILITALVFIHFSNFLLTAKLRLTSKRKI